MDFLVLNSFYKEFINIIQYKLTLIIWSVFMFVIYFVNKDKIIKDCRIPFDDFINYNYSDSKKAFISSFLTYFLFPIYIFIILMILGIFIDIIAFLLLLLFEGGYKW